MGIKFLPKGKTLILASQSPRRQNLLRTMGYNFEIRTQDVEEDYDENLQAAEIAEFLAGKKAKAFRNSLADNEIVLTSDTVVWCENQHLAKAENAEKAEEMLLQLSGKSHEVHTAVCLFSNQKTEVFSDKTTVHFLPISIDEIRYYLSESQPFDKAGAYGIQDWIGMWAIEKIEGSYFTVMGLPTHMVRQRLAEF